MDDRRDDWRHGVDENLNALNAGQRSLDHSLRELNRLLRSLSHVVYGNPEERDPGFDARIEKLEDRLRRLDGTMWPDPAGSKGLVAEFRALQERREDKRTIWGNWTKLAVAAIMSGLITHFWGSLSSVFRKSQDPLDQMIEKAKSPRQHRRIVSYHHIQAKEALESTAETEKKDP